MTLRTITQEKGHGMRRWHRRASDDPHLLLRGSFCCSAGQAGSFAELKLCNSASCVSLSGSADEGAELASFA